MSLGDWFDNGSFPLGWVVMSLEAPVENDCHHLDCDGGEVLEDLAGDAIGSWGLSWLCFFDGFPNFLDGDWGSVWCIGSWGWVLRGEMFVLRGSHSSKVVADSV